MRKICIVTGSRADYGILSRLMRLIKDDPALSLQIIATNMHLSPEFGLTYKEIENDGFRIDKKVEMLLSSDTSASIVKSFALAAIGFSDAYKDLEPDLLLVLGDRYEILAAVITALLFKIPVAHLHGGEITEGSYDDAIRHSVTKMSHMHFTSTDDYRNRVIQLGENPDRVFNVGALGVDNIRHLHLLSKKELEKRLNFKFSSRTVLVTYHPVTLESGSPESQVSDLLSALKSVENLRIIFTAPNSDTNGRIIMNMVKEFVAENSHSTCYFPSLGKLNYLSSLQYVDAVVGNSSSGIIEAPSFGIPTLNIGSRQNGRTKGSTIVDCQDSLEEIKQNLKTILSSEFKQACKNSLNPYEKENTANVILEIIKNYNLNDIVIKRFHTI